ncbi:hypothetical protein RT41_GL000509 [Lactococcus fujiensis JCM 16395]|uniref:Uncharacterized protein n=1 Tax=Lactococcus fujiensis JCM 16395 TaxID=1291764 RepID=A0A2A5RIZ0_9LACT|nr:hypothetical protein RT41_GL000509 [Lactococcus fujiensis JCM 16395]
MVEFCQPDMPVYLVSKSMDVKTTTVGELLPYSFKNLS